MDAVYERLTARNMALCLAESDKLEVPKVMTANFDYFRLRKGDYSEEGRQEIASRVRKLLDGGLDAYAAANAGLKIVAREDNIGDVEETGRPITAALLDAYPDIDAIWCFNDYTALAAGKEMYKFDEQFEQGLQIIIRGLRK